MSARLTDEELAELERNARLNDGDVARWLDLRRSLQIITELRSLRALLAVETGVVEHITNAARAIEPSIEVDTRAWVPCEGGTVTTLSDWIRKQATKSRAALLAKGGAK